MKTLLNATVLIGLALLAHVASAQRTRQLSGDVFVDSSSNSVTVQNNRNSPVTVYLSSNRLDRRLGVVEAYSVSTLPLPSWTVNGNAMVHLFARSDNAVLDLTTPDFKLQSPARIGMVVPAAEQMSGVRDTESVDVAPEDAAEATITVDNPRTVAVAVIAERGPFDFRLGQIAAGSRATLRFPRSLVGSSGALVLYVRPQSGLDFVSNPMQVRSGDHLALRLPKM